MVIIYIFCLLHAFLNLKNHEIFSLMNLKHVINFGSLGLWGGVATVLP